MAPSVTDATAILDTPNEDRTLHSITVTCTINPDSDADMCEVVTTINGQATLTGNEYEYMHDTLCTYVCTYIKYMYIYLNTIHHYSRT